MMGGNPYVLLLGVFFALFLGARGWRRRKLKRAVRELPTRMRRLVGEEPDYDPPVDLPEGLAGYAALHRRSALIMRAVWAVAFVWLAYVIFLLLEQM